MKRQNLPEGFDPYADRTARDIRNELSKAFIRALGAGTRHPVEGEAEKWLAIDLPAPCKTFIRNRLPRYGAVLAEIQGEGIADPLHRAVVIWNHGLFFEVHEQVEDFWHESTGSATPGAAGVDSRRRGLRAPWKRETGPRREKLAQKAGKWLLDAPWPRTAPASPT